MFIDQAAIEFRHWLSRLLDHLLGLSDDRSSLSKCRRTGTTNDTAVSDVSDRSSRQSCSFSAAEQQPSTLGKHRDPRGILRDPV